MKQYCRYCAHANQVDEGLVHCSEKDTVMVERQAKAQNNCKSFLFNEIDVFNLEKVYCPRDKRNEKRDDGYKQTSVFDKE